MSEGSEYMVVEIDYTNWRGERGICCIIPIGMQFASSERRPEPQWVLWAIDKDKMAQRTFAMKDIHSWRPVT